MYCPPMYYSSLFLKEPLPGEPNDLELLIQLKACGCCHTDTHMINGEWKTMNPPLPFCPGHEGVGIVRKVGSFIYTIRFSLILIVKNRSEKAYNLFRLAIMRAFLGCNPAAGRVSFVSVVGSHSVFFKRIVAFPSLVVIANTLRF
jgi:hypothetical protein